MRAADSGGSGSSEHLDALVKKDKVVVFLKGTPEQPQCGFSNAVVQILRLHGVRDYAAYNVLDDPQLRQGQGRLQAGLGGDLPWPLCGAEGLSGRSVRGLEGRGLGYGFPHCIRVGARSSWNWVLKIWGSGPACAAGLSTSGSPILTLSCNRRFGASSLPLSPRNMVSSPTPSSAGVGKPCKGIQKEALISRHLGTI